ncbi:hypothetical protein L6R53_10210 [Myxococcota bacterium]|nr:hypothetical protein [Myxococcota bacterium]
MGPLLVLWACAGPPAPSGGDVATSALAPWPSEPAALLDRCRAEPIAELATTCRVQAAALLAGQGRGEEAGQVCAEVPAGTWQEECHFRVGEELAVAGQAAAAAAWCGRAGWFARRCVTHAAWRLRLPPGLGPDADGEALTADADELLATVQAGLAHHPDPGVAGEGTHAFQAAWGRAVYLGSGRANPAPARAAGDHGPALRTGWATEAVRLLGPTPPDDALARLQGDWEGQVARSGPPDPAPAPARYAPLQVGPQDEGLPHLPLYGGGMRLVGQDADEDATIAIVEALYGHPAVTAAHLSPALSDPRPRVRWTAARLVALCLHQEDPAGAPTRAGALAAAAPDEVTARLLRESRPPAPAGR